MHVCHKNLVFFLTNGLRHFFRFLDVWSLLQLPSQTALFVTFLHFLTKGCFVVFTVGQQCVRCWWISQLHPAAPAGTPTSRKWVKTLFYYFFTLFSKQEVSENTFLLLFHTFLNIYQCPTNLQQELGTRVKHWNFPWISWMNFDLFLFTIFLIFKITKIFHFITLFLDISMLQQDRKKVKGRQKNFEEKGRQLFHNFLDSRACPKTKVPPIILLICLGSIIS